MLLLDTRTSRLPRCLYQYWILPLPLRLLAPTKHFLSEFIPRLSRRIRLLLKSDGEIVVHAYFLINNRSWLKTYLVHRLRCTSNQKVYYFVLNCSQSNIRLTLHRDVTVMIHGTIYRYVKNIKNYSIALFATYNPPSDVCYELKNNNMNIRPLMLT